MFQCSVINNDGILYEDTIASITIPTTDGIQTLLPKHMDIILALGLGKGYIKKDNSKKEFVLEGGLLVFKDNVCTVYPNSFWIQGMSEDVSSYPKSMQDLVGSVL